MESRHGQVFGNLRLVGNVVRHTLPLERTRPPKEALDAIMQQLT
jgi:hypothetical protein